MCDAGQTERGSIYGCVRRSLAASPSPCTRRCTWLVHGVGGIVTQLPAEGEREWLAPDYSRCLDVAGHSHTRVVQEEIVMKVECGSKPGFSTSGWMATSTYQVNVIMEGERLLKRVFCALNLNALH